MHVYGKDYALIALNKTEIKTIISALEDDWRHWSIKEAGILLAQFEQLEKELSKQEADISDDSI